MSKATKDTADRWLELAFRFDRQHPYTGGDDAAPPDEYKPPPSEKVATRSWEWWETRYSDDQPRDDHGRWTGGGGSGHALDTSEMRSILSYQQGASFGDRRTAATVNASLRGGLPLTSAQLQATAALDTAIEGNHLRADDTLYRAVYQAPGSLLVQPPDYASMEPGTRFADKGFISTTDDASFVGDTLKNYSGTAPDYVLQIEASKGSEALDVNDVLGTESVYPDQNEVILPRGSEFEVVRQESSRTVVRLRG